MDLPTVAGFGEEWRAFDQSALQGREYQAAFDAYFSLFPFGALPKDAEGFDLGCGSGRWAMGVASRVGQLHCIDPASLALDVAKRRMAGFPGVSFHLASVDSIPLADASQDFGYSLGVLHHVPDTADAIASCVRKLKPKAPFLLYLYYSFDQRPAWYRALWRGSDTIRRRISSLPFPLRKAATNVLALLVYWPLARTARLAARLGLPHENIPLSAYRHSSLYTMRTDALDRFGTRLEQRFSRDEIEAMMRAAGLEDIRFRDAAPYWVACGCRSAEAIERTTAAKRAATTSAE